MNRIGTLGDIATEVYEIALMFAALASALWLSDYSATSAIINAGTIATCLFILGPTVLLVMEYGSTLPVGEDDIEVHRGEIGEIRVRHCPRRSLSGTGDMHAAADGSSGHSHVSPTGSTGDAASASPPPASAALGMAYQASRTGLTCDSIGGVTVQGVTPHTPEADVSAARTSGGGLQWLGTGSIAAGFRDLSAFFLDRVRYLCGNPILVNCICLSMVSSCFEYMFDGPVTLTRAMLSKSNHGECGGAVDFLLLQGLFLQLLYLAGGLVYFKLIMRLHPAGYYGSVFPVMSVVFMVATVAQFISLGETAAAFTISAITVTSYYMSIYNSYVLSGASRVDMFGFVQGVYSVAVGVAGFVPSVLQLAEVSQALLMLVAFVMAAWGLVQSLHLWRSQFAKDHGEKDTWNNKEGASPPT